MQNVLKPHRNTFIMISLQLIVDYATMNAFSCFLPHTRYSFKFSSVERTLCPLLNSDPDEAMLQVSMEISTTSPTPVQCTLTSSFVENFYHQLVPVLSVFQAFMVCFLFPRLDSVGSLTASPSSPAVSPHVMCRREFDALAET